VNLWHYFQIIVYVSDWANNEWILYDVFSATDSHNNFVFSSATESSKVYFWGTAQPPVTPENESVKQKPSLCSLFVENHQKQPVRAQDVNLLANDVNDRR